MIHRFIGTGARLVQYLAGRPVTWSSVNKTARGLLTTAQHTLTVFGLSAVAMLALLYNRPDLANRMSDVVTPATNAPAATPAVQAAPQAATAGVTQAPVVATVAAPKKADDDAASSVGNSRQQKYVTQWLSRRYRVAGDAANLLVSTAYNTAHDIKLDPLLILAVMAIESGLNPFAESPVGAQGLMQVMAKVHSDKFRHLGGIQAAFNPIANIRVGAEILKDYVTRTGSVEAGLRGYVGAGPSDDNGYGAKVMAEYQRLKQVATGKSVPTNTPLSKPAPGTTVALKQAPAPAPAKADTAEPTANSAQGASESGATVAGL